MRKLSNYLVVYLFPILATELLFRYLAGNFNHGIFILRSLIFSIFISFILWALNNAYKIRFIKYFTIFTFIIFPLYGLIQIAIDNYYGIMFSVRILLKGTPDVASYAGDFVKSLEPAMLLFIVIAITSIIIYRKSYTYIRSKRSWKFNLLSLTLSIALLLSYIGSLFILEPKNIFVSSPSLFVNPYMTEAGANQLGMSALFMSDLQFLIFRDKALKDEIIVDEPVDPPIIDEPNLYINRKFNDDAWKQLMDDETNDVLKSIDSYFLYKPITPTNDATGRYKGKNFIYILTEAFDMVAIHETLTPTLYKLKTQGTYMENFYSPQFNCATAESELISMTSIIPLIGTCTMSAHYESASSQTVFNIFKDAGYKTSSYHNWNDQFYPRSKIHPTLGSDKYLDSKQLIPSLISGWQSDLTMMKGIVKDLNKSEGPFMGYIITSSTHLPYDEPSNLGTKYVNEIKKVYPDAPYEILTYLSKAMELDKAMAYLLDNLDAIDNTVIAMFADHRPLRMPSDYLVDYSDVNRSGAYDLERTPMFFYTPNQKPEVIDKVSGTMDMLPTIANLFDLKHDPRLFMGDDLFGKETPVVTFYNGSWYDQVGYFNTKTSIFTPFKEDITYDSDQIQKINAAIKQKFSISSRLYTSDYFNKRELIRNRALSE